MRKFDFGVDEPTAPREDLVDVDYLASDGVHAIGLAVRVPRPRVGDEWRSPSGCRRVVVEVQVYANGICCVTHPHAGP